MFVILALVTAVVGLIVASPLFDGVGNLHAKWLPWMIALSVVTGVSVALNLLILWRCRPRPIWGRFTFFKGRK